MKISSSLKNQKHEQLLILLEFNFCFSEFYMVFILIREHKKSSETETSNNLLEDV